MHRLARPTPQTGDGRVERAPVDPGHGDRVSPEGWERSPQLIDDLLDEVLAVGSIQRVHPGHPLDRSAVFVYQCHETGVRTGNRQSSSAQAALAALVRLISRWTASNLTSA